MIELEVYACGLRANDSILQLQSQMDIIPEARYKVDANHDLVYFEIDRPDTITQRQIARVFEQGLGAPVGYVVPLRRIPSKPGQPRWTSQPWFVSASQLFLLPGDSPLGYRLPLESLPWTKPEDVEWTFEADPFRKRGELPPARFRKPPFFTEPLRTPKAEALAELAEPPSPAITRDSTFTS